MPDPAAPTAAPTTPPTAAAVIYVRISRDKEGAGLGVERQETECRELAARLGLSVARTDVYSDNDVSASGYSRKVRKGYRRMLADLAHPGAPRTVLAWHPDRLHRQPIELEEWIILAETHGITVETVRAGTVDLATPAGRMFARQLGTHARYEVEHKSDRIRSKMTQKAAEGEWLGGRIPFGWRTTDEKGRLEIEPKEAALVALGTRMLLDGGSVRAVTATFRASDVAPPRGETWERRSVSRVLRRWRNAGLHEHRGEVGRSAAWPAIPGVSADDVRAVREVLDAPDRNRSGGNEPRHLLSHIATCATCGAPMRSAREAKTGKRQYRCTVPGAGHAHRVAEPIDDLVREVIAARLARPDVADLLPAADPVVDVAALRASLRADRARLDDLAVMLADGDLTRTAYGTAQRRVADRIDAAERALSAATRRSPVAPLLSAADPAAAFLAAPLDVQRAVLRELVTVTIGRQGPGRRPFDPTTVAIVWNDAKTDD